MTYISPTKVTAFSGHRSFKACADPTLFDSETELSDGLDALRPRLIEVVAELCRDGCQTFLCGMAEGFDLLAAETVLELEGEFHNIRLVAVIPHSGQSAKYDEQTAERYNNILERAHERVVMQSEYTPDCFHRRNDYLLANSDTLVCFFNGSKGGTAYTVRRARRTGHRVINVSGCEGE